MSRLDFFWFGYERIKKQSVITKSNVFYADQIMNTISISLFLNIILNVAEVEVQPHLFQDVPGLLQRQLVALCLRDEL